ncbi:MAG: WXG100 family type VII secretion target [Bellilinea sp.]|nr:WXG100 family type VII secretion target [Bellilinea sp.]
MGAYTIRLTPQELRQHASEIETNAEIVRREVDRISQEIEKLRPTFLGQAADAFMKEFAAARTDMEQWDDIVRQFSDLLRNTANTIEAKDRQLSGH